jgi:hypothetical protein
MTTPEDSGGLEPLDIAGKYCETLPLDINTVADGATLGLFGGRYGEQWNLNVRDFTGLTGIPDDEHMPPELGEIRTEADPHPLDSFESYDFAHQIAAGWLVDRGLRIVHDRDRLGARLYGTIVCSTYVIAKTPAE